MKKTNQKETDTGTPDVGTDPNGWQTMLGGILGSVGTVLADNLTRNNQRTEARQPSAAPTPWYMQPAVMIGGGIAAVLVLVLALRRR